MSQLRSVTCHMGSHSVTCYPTQVSAPGPVLINFVDQANAANHYTTPPPGGVQYNLFIAFKFII